MAQLASLRIEPVGHEGTVVLSSVVARPELYQCIQEGQMRDADCEILRVRVKAVRYLRTGQRVQS